MIITLNVASKGMTTANLFGQTYLCLMMRLGVITILAIRFVKIYFVPREPNSVGRGCYPVWPWHTPSQPLNTY